MVFESVMVSVRSIYVVMLFMVVMVMVSWLILVVKSFFFVRICVRIGNVVMDIVMFMKMRNGLNFMFLVMVWWSMKEIFILDVNGIVIFVVDMVIVCGFVLWICCMLSFSFIMNKKKSSFICVKYFRMIIFCLGKMFVKYCVFFLRVDGLRRILF